MPALSPTMTSGVIVKWHKQEGDKINAGDILCEIQTDKAIVAYEFDDDAVLAKILIEENSSEINLGHLIAIVCDENDDWKNVSIPKNLDEIQATKPEVSSESKKEAKDKEEKKRDLSNIKISPSARNLIDQYGIELAKIKPSGPHGYLIKEDVINFISKNNLKPKSLSAKTSTQVVSKQQKVESQQDTLKNNFIDIELSNMRKTIAKRLTESKSNIPHAYMSIKCLMDELIKLRQDFKNRSSTISINDMIVKATAIALKQVPMMNCIWDNSTESIKLIPDVDVSMAVATSTGLITPIIRNANLLSLAEISSISKGLINKAKENKLKPDEFIGGTFSISNLGMYDIDHFIAVINPPQAAILAVGSNRQRFFGEPDDYQIKNQCIMTLSYDSRAIDEELAAYFLENLKNNLNDVEIILNSDGSNNRRLSYMLN